MSSIPPSNNPLAALIPTNTDNKQAWRWGYVMRLDPLTVWLDGDTRPSLTSPDTLCPLESFDRVLVHIYNRRATIIGKATNVDRSNNPSESKPIWIAENSLWINGVWWQASGTQNMPSYSWAYADGGGWSATTVHMPAPYNPPAGYGFNYSILNSNGFSLLTTTGITRNGYTPCRLLNYKHTSPTITAVQWQLVKQT